MLVLNLPFKALMFLTLMRPSLVLFLVLWLKLVKDFLKVRCRLALLPFLISCLIWLDLVASLPLIKERILVIILLLHFLSLMLGSVLVLMLPLLVWLTPDLSRGFGPLLEDKLCLIFKLAPSVRGFGPLLEDKLCLIFKLAPSVCRMTFPILASLLVRLVVLLPFQLLRLSLATPSRWTPLALSVFLHCVVALLLTLL